MPGYVRCLWTIPLMFGFGAGIASLVRWLEAWHPVWNGTVITTISLSTIPLGFLGGIGGFDYWIRYAIGRPTQPEDHSGHGARSWKDFLETPLSLEPEALVPEGVRHRLDALPGMVRLRGDAVPLEYEVDGGQGLVRVMLREGQARRLTMDELPELDRPIRFAVVRGGEPPLRAATLPELRELLRRPALRRQVHRDRHPPRRGGRRR